MKFNEILLEIIKMKNLLTIFLLIIVQFAFGQSGSIQGTVTDEEGDSLMFANITLRKNDVINLKIQTDENGFYRFDHLEAGNYILEIKYVGYLTRKIVAVKVNENSTEFINLNLYLSLDFIPFFEIKFQPKYNPWNFTQSTTFSADEIQRSPIKN